MKNRLFDAMSHAGRLVQTGQLMDATKVLRRALGDLPAMRREPSGAPTRTRPVARAPAAEEPARATVPPSGHDLFEEVAFHEGSLTGRYKVFVPAGIEACDAPLVVMLHGCTQSPDDFATGTDMNRLARAHGFVVLYPAQSSAANPSSCWNWFRPEDQQRDGGEPALIAAMTRAVVARCGIDPRRVYVAGLSAGGAMAAILGSAYPDVFAAVGVHSGLPSGAARNVPDALTIMRTGTARPHVGRRSGAFVPTIVFHGDADRTVHPDNGIHVVDAALAAAGSDVDPAAVVFDGTAPDGRTFRRTTHRSHAGEALVEHWLVRGAAHAWSGGDRRGSHADPAGPSASAEMLRFFLEHPRTAANR